MRSIQLSGGAPKSTYQYLKILRDDGHKINVIAAQGEKSIEEMYEKAFDKVVYTSNSGFIPDMIRIPAFYIHIIREYRNLKKEKPNLVLILGHSNAFFYTQFCNALKIPHIIIIAGGDLSTGAELIKDCPCEHFVCFSEENKKALLGYFDESRITVISNRIDVKNVFDDLGSHYDFENRKEIRMLLTSRVSHDKIESITEFINTADNVADEKRRIALTVAGDGDSLDMLKKYVDGINNPFLTIEVKGHIDNLCDEFKKAHIAVGKGRSVIEPIMMNRVGCVIGDDGKISVCNEESFNNLYNYNFSGRHLDCDDPEKTLSDLIELLFANKYNLDEIKETAELTAKYYSADYLPEKLYNAFENHKSIEQKKKRIFILPLIVKLVRYKLMKRKKK